MKQGFVSIKYYHILLVSLFSSKVLVFFSFPPFLSLIFIDLLTHYCVSLIRPRIHAFYLSESHKKEKKKKKKKKKKMMNECMNESQKKKIKELKWRKRSRWILNEWMNYWALKEEEEEK